MKKLHFHWSDTMFFVFVLAIIAAGFYSSWVTSLIFCGGLMILIYLSHPLSKRITFFSLLTFLWVTIYGIWGAGCLAHTCRLNIIHVPPYWNWAITMLYGVIIWMIFAAVILGMDKLSSLHDNPN